MRGPGRPKGTPQSPEAREKISAAVRARWSGPERKALEARALAALEKARQSPRCGWRPILRPEPGTSERKLFEKIARVLGAKSAHAEMRRAP